MPDKLQEAKGDSFLKNVPKVEHEQTPFKYIELFAGIGGFRQALDKLGGQCVFASEIDKFAVKSYEALYGDTPAGDITQIDASEIPDHDVLVGGFPCQAFSVAGQRKGFEDTRGTLFFEIARIAAEKQPRLMLLENVKGLLSHDKGRTFEVMCAVLNDLGYVIDFNVLNSKYFGVPQNRERIFIVASRDAEHAEWDVKGTDVVAKAKRRIAALGVRTFNFDWPTNNEVTTRLRDILETDVDEKYYLSDDKTAKLVAQLEDVTIPKTVDGFSMPHDNVSYTITTRVSSETTTKHVKCRQGQLVIEPILVGSLEHYGNDQMNRVYSIDGVAPTITVVSGGGREQKIAEPRPITEEIRPVLTPDRLEKRQNGRRFKDDGEESFTLTVQDIHGVAIGRFPRYRIRKLTPRECWRLQGFSDAAFDRVKSAGVSDSQLYKQAGNAVTVNVVEAIGEKLIRLLSKKSTILERR